MRITNVNYNTNFGKLFSKGLISDPNGEKTKRLLTPILTNKKVCSAFDELCKEADTVSGATKVYLEANDVLSGYTAIRFRLNPNVHKEYNVPGIAIKNDDKPGAIVRKLNSARRNFKKEFLTAISGEKVSRFLP